MPQVVECTLRANQPLSTPTIMPLIVDPIRMPPIAERASGVNQAVAPSMTPRIAPKTSPTTILFIKASLPPPSYSAFAAVPLSAPQEKQKKSHGDVGGEQEQQNPV